MKIAVSASGKTLESIMDQRFGRAAFFLIVDSETMEFEAIDNQGASSGGAGVAGAQIVSEHGTLALITGNVGPNALEVLNAAGISICRGKATSIRENIEEYKRGTLEKIDTAVASHFGMGAGSPK
ncbi:MAG TPA: dinitrogenase iron-molybdenum cofactor biosynthesis protein [Firmicutes bacterium]|jgi:predicted Fe-Mo cluster-binding NifX family protein|nr:dinitrogenase iron-molybdenum cofactor biosynthesis protein [Bacillota bacterium]